MYIRLSKDIYQLALPGMTHADSAARLNIDHCPSAATSNKRPDNTPTQAGGSADLHHSYTKSNL